MNRPMTEDELTLVAVEAQRANDANSALLRAHAAHTLGMSPAAAMLRQEAANRVNQAVMMDNLNAGNWFGAQAAVARHQQQAAAQHHVAAQAAQAAAQPNHNTNTNTTGGTTNTNNNTAANTGTTSDESSTGIIPIGFFRDPRGNAWAASLQHPSQSFSSSSNQNSNEQPLTSSYQHAARQAIVAAQRRKQQQQQDEVIDLQSDDDEDDDNDGAAAALMEDELQVTRVQAAPRQANVPAQQRQAATNQAATATNQRPGTSMPSANIAAALRDGTITQMLQGRIPTTFANPVPLSPAAPPPKTSRALPKRASAVPTHLVNLNSLQKDQQQQQQQRVAAAILRQQQQRPAPSAAARPPTKRQKVEEDAVLEAAAANNAAAQKAGMLTPSQLEMRERHERALRAVKQSEKPHKALYGPFVQRWLGTGLSTIDKERDVKENIDKILMAATGYTTETAPSSLPFPPAEINLDMDQLEELSQDIVTSKNQAIGEAVRCAYSEMKSRHDEITSTHKRNSDESQQHRREVAMLTLRHKNSIRDLQTEHDEALEKQEEKLKLLESQIQQLKEESLRAKTTQSKSLETMMKASILSLRMIRRSETNKQHLQ